MWSRNSEREGLLLPASQSPIRISCLIGRRNSLGPFKHLDLLTDNLLNSPKFNLEAVREYGSILQHSSYTPAGNLSEVTDLFLTWCFLVAKFQTPLHKCHPSALMGLDSCLLFDLCTDTTPVLLGVWIQGKSAIKWQIRGKNISRLGLALIHAVWWTDVTLGTKVAMVSHSLGLSGGTLCTLAKKQQSGFEKLASKQTKSIYTLALATSHLFC